MKKLLLIIMFCMSALQARQPDAFPAKGEKETVNWEYKTIEIARLQLHYSVDFEALDIEINNFASEGWELVTLCSTAHGYQYITGSIIATFKRPKSAVNPDLG